MVSRRSVLRLAGLAGAGALLAGPAQAHHKPGHHGGRPAPTTTTPATTTTTAPPVSGDVYDDSYGEVP